MKTANDHLFDLQTEFQAHLAHQYRHGSENTPKSAMQHVRVFVAWWEEENQAEFRPDQLTEHDLHQWRYHSLSEAKVTADTWNARLWALRIFCEHIGQPQLMDDILPQKRGRKTGRHRALTGPESNAILRHVELRVRGAVTVASHIAAVRNAAMIYLMHNAGLRVEEVTQLDLDDIQLSERSGKVNVRHGKGDKERDVPLGLHVRKALASWLDVRHVTTSQALFNGKGTSRLSTRQVERLVKEIGRIAGVPEVTPHWLRYTYAKTLETKFNASTEQICDLLGHSSIETTRRYLVSGFDVLQSLVEHL